MAYTLGVSTGLWGIEKPEELLGIPRKVGWVFTRGVTHAQIDLDRIVEFQEPDLKKKMERLRDFGFTYGMHGEALATGGIDTLPLASALQTDYWRAHDRILTHIKGASEIKSEYITIHTSESTPFILLGTQLQPAALVDPWGRNLKKLLEENKDILQWVVTEKEEGDKDFIWEFIRRRPSELKKIFLENYINRELRKRRPQTDEEAEKLYAELEKKYEKQAEDDVEKFFLDQISLSEPAYGSEKVAYYIVAKWMQERGDPLWQNIVGKKFSDDDFKNPQKTADWVPAVAAKYTWGHFSQDKVPGTFSKEEYEDPKPLLRKHNITWAFETPMAGQGNEGYIRLAKLSHIYYLCKAINSPYISWTLDMEHLLGCNLDPKKEIEELPAKGGELLKIVHITLPSPLNPSHQPIPLGSEIQYYIYERLWDLRRKGFTTGYIIFERGGGQDPVKQTVQSMRAIKKYLEANTAPKELPLEFFGMEKEGPDLALQEVKIKEHALDPIKGLLSIPEEEWTFLSRAATEKGKAEEWKKRQLR